MSVPFEEWMAAEGPALKRAAILLCRDEHEADDLVQETFVRLFTRWAKVEGLANPAGYAQRTLTNVYLSRWRRLRTDRTKGSMFAPAESYDAIGTVTDRAALTAWLQSLGPKQRAAVVWRYYCDLPMDEIATMLGCREATVRAQLSRALATMRRLADSDRALSGKGDRHV